MVLPIRLPPFGTFLNALSKAGVRTATARGFWGGVTESGEIVVTIWTDAHDKSGRFYLWKPKTNHGGLKTQWELGNIRPGTEVRTILVRQRGNVPLGQFGRTVGGAALLPGMWRVVKLVEGEHWQALVEPS